MIFKLFKLDIFLKLGQFSSSKAFQDNAKIWIQVIVVESNAVVAQTHEKNLR